MPYKSEKLKIAGTKYDRRVKLTPEQKEEIRKNTQGLSQRKLAVMYEVSRRTIQFILDPEKQKENLKRKAERGGYSQYYDKDKNAEYVREHRRYKQSLFINKELKLNNNGIKNNREQQNDSRVYGC